MEFIKKNNSKIQIEYLEEISYSNSNYQRKNHTNKDVEVLIKGNL